MTTGITLAVVLFQDSSIAVMVTLIVLISVLRAALLALIDHRCVIRVGPLSGRD